VEFTLFFTFVMGPMVLGVTDISSLLDTHVNLVYAAREAARIGAVLGDRTGADCAIVGAIHATLLNQPEVTLTQVTIFEITYNGLVTGNQEVYSGVAACDPTTGIFNPLPSVDTWPAGTGVRITTPFDEDSIGVTLNFTYTWRFNLLGFGPFNGYDSVQYPINPSGEPTPLPVPTSQATCPPPPLPCGV
jgi:hypothetical protein